MVTQVSTFDPFRIRKFGVGFDSMLEQFTSDFFTDSFQGTQNFPPYNIIKTDEFSYDIEMAVAGFSEEDLVIDYADNVLTVSSKEDEPFKDSDSNSSLVEYIHKGIAVRKFTKKFTLAEDVIVNDANLANGMLTISMEKIVPEGKKKRSIKIVSEQSRRGRKPPTMRVSYNGIILGFQPKDFSSILNTRSTINLTFEFNYVMLTI